MYFTWNFIHWSACSPLHLVPSFRLSNTYICVDRAESLRNKPRWCHSDFIWLIEARTRECIIIKKAGVTKRCHGFWKTWASEMMLLICIMGNVGFWGLNHAEDNTQHIWASDFVHSSSNPWGPKVYHISFLTPWNIPLICDMTLKQPLTIFASCSCPHFVKRAVWQKWVSPKINKKKLRMPAETREQLTAE